MTRNARSLESIAPRHHGRTRVADAPITASLWGCASPPVISSGFLFLSHGRDPRAETCYTILLLLPSRGLDRKDILRLDSSRAEFFPAVQ